MAEHPDYIADRQVRPSDEDRDRVAQRLQEAAAAGRIELTELDQRLAEIYGAKTQGELGYAGRGLPGPTRTDSLVVRDEPGSRFAISVFGWFSRKGRWVAPRVFTSLSVFGGGEIDLRDARFASQEIRVRAFALWGYTEVVVPDDVEVEVKGFGLFGAFDRSAVRSRRGTPRIVISGLALFGGVGTKAKAAPDRD
ncbi:DUF1707 domain-containing protein [Nonomuraea sp. MG754425]|uniref:DUF1707 SHOCT-like domain-containing protein n=1 Tax=Nonomuraea sp. MG754425 TaxID=2570319 RepID=UPI001F19B59F|nr:DUF1707 domain-containing protein [Nonomuraea sp. MG754425]MCF6468488.1 DUF1707 domain-containing protein [Nonomuraea sp. MG754425]